MANQSSYTHYDYETNGAANNGKRTPCPSCGSKTQYHGGRKNGVTFGLKCHACGYKPNNEADTTKQAAAVIGAALCDCGKPLKTANERKANMCHVCLGELNLNFQGDNWPDETAAADDHTATCDCGKPLTTKYQAKIKKCFYCQVIGGLSAKADNSAHALGSFAYSQRKGLSGLLLAESGAVVTELWKRPMLAIPLNDGAAIGYQLIDESGNKKFAFPLVKSTADNAFFHTFIGNRKTASIKVKCEGYATGLSIAMARPDVCVLICSTADNLIKAAKVYGAEFGIIATDNDKSHAGIVKASQAAKIDGSKIWYCPVDSDFNDLHTSQGLQTVADSFTADIYQAASLHLLAVKHGAAFIQSDKPLNELPISEGFTILSAAMGSGKSRLFFPNAKAKGESCVAVAHLKSLVAGLGEVLALDNYEKSDKATDNLATCINSIAKYVQQYNVALTDEFHAVLDWLAFGGTGKDSDHLRAYKALKQILGTASYSIFASATMRPEHVEMVMMLAKELGKPITVIDHTTKPSKKIVILNYGDFTTKRSGALADNRNIFSFSLGKDDTIAYENEIKASHETLAIHSGNSADNMAAITSGDYVNYQAVLGSPSVLAGVHMLGHFHDVFCDFSSKTDISPLSAIQALGRVRTADTVYVTLQGGKDKLSESAFISAERILQGKRNSMISSGRDYYEGLGYSDDEIEAKLAVDIARPFTDYDVFSATLKKAHDDEFMAWNSNFLEYASLLGYEIEDLRHDKSADDKAARRARSEGRKEVKAARYADIAAINLLDFGDIEMLRDKADKSEREQHAIIHADCKDIFESVTPETIKNVLKNDLHGLARNYALARCEGYANQRLLDDVAAIGEGVKSTAAFSNLSAKREVMAALLAVSGVTVDFSALRPDETVATGQYNFSGAAWLSADDVQAVRCDCGDKFSTADELRHGTCYHCQFSQQADKPSVQAVSFQADNVTPLADDVQAVRCECGNEAIAGHGGACYPCHMTAFDSSEAAMMTLLLNDDYGLAVALAVAAAAAAYRHDELVKSWRLYGAALEKFYPEPSLEISADKTNIGAVVDLIKKHRHALGFKQYTTLSHKTVVRLLRDWCGFETESKRLKGGGSVWRVIGLADDLVAIGGENRLKQYQAKVFRDADNLVTFHDSMIPLKEIESENVTEVFTEFTHGDNNQVAALSPELKAEAWLGCAHHWHWHWSEGAPKCDNCGQTFETWHGYNQTMLADVVKAVVYDL